MSSWPGLSFSSYQKIKRCWPAFCTYCFPLSAWPSGSIMAKVPEVGQCCMCTCNQVCMQSELQSSLHAVKFACTQSQSCKQVSVSCSGLSSVCPHCLLVVWPCLYPHCLLVVWPCLYPHCLLVVWPCLLQAFKPRSGSCQLWVGNVAPGHEAPDLWNWVEEVCLF